jgi:hypothetical protein
VSLRYLSRLAPGALLLLLLLLLLILLLLLHAPPPHPAPLFGGGKYQKKENRLRRRWRLEMCASAWAFWGKEPNPWPLGLGLLGSSFSRGALGLLRYDGRVHDFFFFFLFVVVVIDRSRVHVHMPI